MDARGASWREIERSESLRDSDWPTAALRDGATGVRDLTLPGIGAGRSVLIEFAATRERDEDGEHRGEVPPRVNTNGTFDDEAPSPPVRLMVSLSRAPLDRTLSIVGWYIVGVGGALALAGIAASRWAVGRGLDPLRDLSRCVEALGPDTLGTRFEFSDLPDELRPIAEQLSGLLARLEGAFEREKRFSAAASHELRTPIAELRMLLEVAASQPRTSGEWSQTAEAALGVLTRAQSLCETLLRLSRAGAGHPTPGTPSRAEVGPILAEQAARALTLHGGDTRRVRIHCDAGLLARVDDATLSSIVGNLIDNALRHGAATADTPVVVDARASEGGTHIEITNPAPALTQGDLAHLFEPFWRKDASRHDQRGFGLGLAVARTLARASGGDIVARRSDAQALTLEVTMLAAM